MRIQQTSQTSYDNYSSYLLDAAETRTVPQNMKDAQEHLSETKAVDVTISDEGMDALREKLSGFEVESDDIMVSMISLQNTNEVAWEHYTAMREISSMSLKNGNYDVEDLMKSIMDAYETVYNQIIKDHEENGDRQASYKLTGKVSVTLEDDLAGLDEAFKWRLANLQGYITGQQTNKAFGHPIIMGDSGRKSPVTFEKTDLDYYLDKDYQDTAISIMEKAREEFLAFRQNANYKKGSAKGMLTDIINDNVNFVAKTRKLFS